MTLKGFFAGAVQLLKSFPFPGRRTLQFFWNGGLLGERDYSRLVGDGGNNSIVSSCVQYIARTFPEAPPAMWAVDKQGVRNRQLDHPIVQLLRYPTRAPDRPGGFYSGVLLWMATLTSWVLDGNAYWLKVRSQMGRVVQLWYVPHWMIEPRWPQDGSEYISHYDYQVNGQIKTIPISEVVHFRHGLDPQNPRKGLSPLHAVLREVFTDEEAARFSASMLKNMGVPGLVVSPQPSAAGIFRPSADEVTDIKERFNTTKTGDHRGEPIVMSGPTSVAQFGFSPQQLDLAALRQIPEERVTAALGLPAAVVGLGAGLKMTKVGATMAQLRDQAWQSNLIPTQRLMAEEIQIQLLPDFAADLTGQEFGFDTSRVQVLQEDQGKLADRWARLVSAGIAKRSEARTAFDLPSGPEDDVYMPQPGVQDTTPAGAADDATGDVGTTDTASRLDELETALRGLQTANNHH